MRVVGTKRINSSDQIIHVAARGLISGDADISVLEYVLYLPDSIPSPIFPYLDDSATHLWATLSLRFVDQQSVVVEIHFDGGPNIVLYQA